MSHYFEPIVCADIEWSSGFPYASMYQDIYFSAHGIDESRHVFIEGNHLIQRFKAFGPHEPHWPHFVIAECGFGTGLNFLLTLKFFLTYAPKTARLHFFSVEKHPLTRLDLIRCHTLWPSLCEESLRLQDVYPEALTPGAHHLSMLSQRVVLNLILGDAKACLEALVRTGDPSLESYCRDFFVDAWFLDGFSPQKNPNMWSLKLFETIALLSKEGTTLATFSAAGHVFRSLASVGFHVTRPAGYGAKRQMIRAVFVGHTPVPSQQVKRTGYTPWYVPRANRLKPPLSVIIVGAGLAGCFMAYELAHFGFKVILIDQASGVAQKASQSTQAVLYPTMSIYNAPLTRLMLEATQYAIKCYAPWIKAGWVEGECTGVLQLAVHEQLRKHHASLEGWLNAYPALGTLVSAEKASWLAGVPVEHDGLWMPEMGFVNMPQLCSFLIKHPKIECVWNTAVSSLKYEDECWHAGVYQAPYLVLATGSDTSLLEPYALSYVTRLKGQMTAVLPSSMSKTLAMPICAHGHVTPVQGGRQWLGATYHTSFEDDAPVQEDDEHHLALFKSLFHGDTTVVGHWANVRLSTRDHLPIVGSVPFDPLFSKTYDALKYHTKRYIPEPMPHYPGLFYCTGFGSRGLTTVPYCAKYLASWIAGSPFPASRSLMQSLSLGRFLIKKISHSSTSGDGFSKS